jgi:hypothetical protein
MMPRTGNSATGYALRSIPRARNAQQRLNRRISQTGNSLHLSTVAKSKGNYPSWVKIESAGWVRIQSARTGLTYERDTVRREPFALRSSYFANELTDDLSIVMVKRIQNPYGVEIWPWERAGFTRSK